MLCIYCNHYQYRNCLRDEQTTVMRLSISLEGGAMPAFKSYLAVSSKDGPRFRFNRRYNDARRHQMWNGQCKTGSGVQVSSHHICYFDVILMINFAETIMICKQCNVDRNLVEPLQAKITNI